MRKIKQLKLYFLPIITIFILVIIYVIFYYKNNLGLKNNKAFLQSSAKIFQKNPSPSQKTDYEEFVSIKNDDDIESYDNLAGFSGLPDTSIKDQKFTIQSSNSVKTLTFEFPSDINAEIYDGRYKQDSFPAVKFSKNSSEMVFNELAYFSTSGSFYCINCQEIGQMRLRFGENTIEIPVLFERYADDQYITRFFISPYLEKNENPDYEKSPNAKPQFFPVDYPVNIRAESLDDFMEFLKIIENLKGQ